MPSSIPDMPQTVLGGGKLPTIEAVLVRLTVRVDHAGQDEGLKNLMMAWYYAGYYTGLYEGQQKAAGNP